MIRQKILFPVLLILFSGTFLLGCRKEIARESIQSVGHFEFVFQNDADPKILWTDLDIEYIDKTDIWYEIEFLRDGDFVQEVSCNPFEHEYRLMSRKTEVQGLTKESFLAPMLCDIDLPNGNIEVLVDLFAEGGRVRIFRADLVIRDQE